MDFGDIIRLLFFAFIFLSFFGGGLFNRNRSDRTEADDQPTPRPTDISQSGGQDQQRPRQQAPAQPRPQERQMPTTASEWWEELTGQRPQQSEPAQQKPREPERQVFTYDDRLEQEPPRQNPRRQSARSAVREGERQLLEQDITDMPPPMDTHPRRRRRSVDVSLSSVSDARGKRTGGDVLRESLRKPDTLERAFILKEVLDEPIAMRDKR